MSFWNIFKRWSRKRSGFRFGGYSDQGPVRSDNQDSFGWHADTDRPEELSVFVVADGMGGLQLGKEASDISVHEIVRLFADGAPMDISASLRSALTNANTRIREMNDAAGSVGGTTCSILVLNGHEAVIGHIGDSRVYQLQGQSFRQVTNDHTVVSELGEDYAGVSSSLLSRALGVSDDIDPQIELVDPLTPKSAYLICSDGLHRYVEDSMVAIISNNEPDEAAKSLVDLALERGSRDNVTAVVIKGY